MGRRPILRGSLTLREHTARCRSSSYLAFGSLAVCAHIVSECEPDIRQHKEDALQRYTLFFSAATIASRVASNAFPS